MEKTICELFAGVGGFRLGFEKQSKDWKTVWFSQWEPGAKVQWAHDCYVKHWGDIDQNTGLDIATVNKKEIPNHTLLVGGFPCQDYSVARSLVGSQGIEGKKGVLWWQIKETLEAKKAPFILLENVDRLLKSPASQRGRDFGVMLACLASLGYSVEWRVINAAEYGAAQRRRRTFIFAYKNNTKYSAGINSDIKDIFKKSGFFAKAFPIKEVSSIKERTINYKDILDVSENFAFNFENAGYMKKGKVYTTTVTPRKYKPKTLGAILTKKNVDEHYYVGNKEQKWKDAKGAHKKERTTKEGYTYVFSEGAIPCPDKLDAPARTMLTSEGTLNRSSHLVEDQETHKLRIITPEEAERIQGFKTGWTKGMPERMRYFCMGNALVVPMITRMAKVLGPIIEQE